MEPATELSQEKEWDRRTEARQESDRETEQVPAAEDREARAAEADAGNRYKSDDPGTG
jgi:hypothetical protein